MISDVLSEANDEIDRYLREMPHVYAFMRPRIDALRAEMEAVRIILDTPPKSDSQKVDQEAPAELRAWEAGDPYCGTYEEALNYALDVCAREDDGDYSAIAFLRSWRESDLSSYPEFKFTPQPVRT